MSESLSQLRIVGAMIGASNARWWEDLIAAYGLVMVKHVVEELHAETLQPVNAAQAQKQCEQQSQREREEQEDAAEDSAASEQVAQSPKVGQSARQASVEVSDSLGMTATAAVPLSSAKAPAADRPLSTQAGSSTAAGEKAKRDAATNPWGLRKKEDSYMAKNKTKSEAKQLLDEVEKEIQRRGIRLSHVMKAIGVSPAAIYDWRKAGGITSASTAQKARTWLQQSQAHESKNDIQSIQFVRPERIQRPVYSLDDLFHQGSELAQSLRKIGSNEAADTINQLVERLRKVAQAVR